MARRNKKQRQRRQQRAQKKRQVARVKIKRQAKRAVKVRKNTKQKTRKINKISSSSRRKPTATKKATKTVRSNRKKDEKNLKQQERAEARKEAREAAEIEESYKETDSQIKDNIKSSGDSDSKAYQKFDYSKALTKSAKDAKSRDTEARENTSTKAEKLSIGKKKLDQISRKTGYDKVKDRISSQGRLEDKKGSIQAKPPSLDKYRKEIKKIKSPYAKKIASIGGRYNKQTRASKSRSRLDDLAAKLKPNNSSPFGKTFKKTKKIRSGYGDKGSDLLKQFSTTKRSAEVKQRKEDKRAARLKKREARRAKIGNKRWDAATAPQEERAPWRNT